jgi:hypothetical protein
MTHSRGKPHTNVGDRGQRFEIRARRRGKTDGFDVIGWAETERGAKDMMSAVEQWPRYSKIWIIDRQEK